MINARILRELVGIKLFCVLYLFFCKNKILFDYMQSEFGFFGKYFSWS